MVKVISHKRHNLSAHIVVLKDFIERTEVYRDSIPPSACLSLKDMKALDRILETAKSSLERFESDLSAENSRMAEVQGEG